MWCYSVRKYLVCPRSSVPRQVVYAIKKSQCRLPPPRMQEEFRALIQLRHVNILGLNEVLEDATTLYLIYEPLQSKALSLPLRHGSVEKRFQAAQYGTVLTTLRASTSSQSPAGGVTAPSRSFLDKIFEDTHSESEVGCGERLVAPSACACSHYSAF